MKVKVLLSLTILCTTLTLRAQTNFKPGYVIKINGDTLSGEIDYRGDLLMSEVCHFKIADKEIKFSPDSILGYRFIDGKYLISKEVNGTNVFLEFLIKGKVNVYYLRSKGDHYYIEKDGMKLSEIQYEEKIVRQDGKQFLQTSTKHIGLLNTYMQDAPELKSRIVSIGKPDHNNLIKLAETYHNKVCKDESCIIYEKKVRWLAANLEFVNGFVNYKKSDNQVNGFAAYNSDNHVKGGGYFTTGFIAHLSMFSANEKLYIRTGTLFSIADILETKSDLITTSKKELLFKVPLQFEYIYPKGIIRPKFAYGVNIYKPFYQSVAVLAGLDITLSKSLSLGINYDIDFKPIYFILVPGSVLSQSVLAGLIIKL